MAKTSGGVDLYKAKLQDTSLAGFETHEYFGFVVSDLGQDDMLQLAASLAPGLWNAVDETPGTEKASAKGVLTASGLAGSFQERETGHGACL